MTTKVVFFFQKTPIKNKTGKLLSIQNFDILIGFRKTLAENDKIFSGKPFPE